MGKSRSGRSRSRQPRGGEDAARALLWKHLSRIDLDGVKFRRNFMVGKFPVEFCAPWAQLVVELDDGRRRERTPAERERAIFMERAGINVIRFWTEEVTRNIEGVLAVIDAALTQWRA